MIKTIIDCDNTAGIPGRPMDDALAILYLLGRKQLVEILGITCNPGNGTAYEVYRCCRELLDETGYTEIPLLAGADRDDEEAGEAAAFIVETVDAHPGEVSFLGIGSLGNLAAAATIDRGIYEKLDKIILMGGITEALYIHGGRRLSELNFSYCADAAAQVLEHGRNITVITGNNCLEVSELPKEEFLDSLDLTNNPTGMYIAKKCGYRFRDKELIYDADSSYCWDGVAAAYLLKPELFDDRFVKCFINRDDMKSGYLHPVSDGSENAVLNIPGVKSGVNLRAELYDGWRHLEMASSEPAFSCNGVYLDKLIQPAVLVALSEQPMHGFALMQQLIEDGLIPQDTDPTGFYRSLKRLERDGCLSSVTEGSGRRRRRTYSVTDLGSRALINWQETLTRYRSHLDFLLERISETTENKR